MVRFINGNPAGMGRVESGLGHFARQAWQHSRSWLNACLASRHLHSDMCMSHGKHPDTLVLDPGC